MSTGIIVAFYAFQDVDYSSVLDDVAINLARKGQRILVSDWNLPSSTLERHFSGTLERQPNAFGLLDVLRGASRGAPIDYREALARAAGLGIPFLGCGLPQEPFDWQEFYHDHGGGAFIESLRQTWKRDFDLTLIDVGSGWGDTQAVSTIQLADVAVTLFSDETDLRGLLTVMRRIQESRQRLAYERMRLSILPVPLQSDAEPVSASAPLADGNPATAEFFDDWLPRSLSPSDVLHRIRVDPSGWDRTAAPEATNAASRRNRVAVERIARFLASDFNDFATLAGAAAHNVSPAEGHLTTRTAPAHTEPGALPLNLAARTSANPGAMSVLRANPIFRELPEDLLDRVAELCENRRYRRNEVVFAEGAPGTKLYGVIAGRLLISTSSPEGQDLHLNVVEQGEIVGEIAFLDGGLRTATGRAAEAVTCFEIDRAPFFKLLDRTPLLGVHLLQLVCRRVRWMTRLAADSAFLSVPERLAARMLDLAKPLGDGTQRAEVKISQADLAEFLGISRQVVNSYLRAWQRDGRVELHRGKIIINDPSQLLPKPAKY